MAGGEVLANIILKGDESAARGFENVGDEMEETGGSAGVLSAALTGLAGQFRDVIVPARLAGSAIDEAGDEAEESAVGFAALSASSDGLRLSLGAISGNITSVVVGIGGLLAILSPLVPVLGLAAGATLGLAAAFGAILGTGILAFGEKRASQNKAQLKQVESKISKLEALKDTEKGLTKAQEAQLDSLKEQAKTLEEGSTAAGGLASALKGVWEELKPTIVAFGQQFVPLIEAAISALPSFVKSLLNAVGNLDPFVSALKALGGAAADILPRLIKLFVDLARRALPVFHDIGNFLAANLVPALDALFRAGERAAGPVLRLGLALGDLISALAPAAGIIGRVVLSLYDLAAVGIGGLASGITSVVDALTRGVGVFREFASLIRMFLLPAISSMIGAWAAMDGRVSSVASSMADAIHGRLLRAMQTLGTEVFWTLSQMATWWANHGQGVVNTINSFSRHAQEAVIQMMAAISSAFAGTGESEASFGHFFMESLREMLAAARVIGAQLPAPIQRAMSLVSGAVRTNIQQVRAALAAARGVWKQHGAAVTAFATRAVGALRTFAGMVRTAITQPLATFARLRSELNKMLPPFLRIQTTARDLGTAIQSKLLPALAASGLLGIATKLAPLLSGPLLGAFTALRGVGVRLAAIFGGPLVGAARLLLGPLATIGTLIAGTLLPVVGSLARVLAGPLVSALVGIVGLFNPITLAIGAVVGALYLLGAASKEQLATFSRIMGDIASVVKSALTTAWNWVSTVGIKLAATALGALATGAIRAFNFGKEHLLPTIQRGIRRAFNWAKTSGVQIATNALKALGRLAVAAFNFGKNNLLPKIQTALRGAFNWVKGPGAQLGKQALGALGRLAVAGFRFGKTQLLPKIQTGVRGAWSWVKGPGAQLGKQALRAMVRLAVAVVDFGQALLTKLRPGITAVGNWIKTRGLNLFKAAFRSIGPNLGNAVTSIITTVTNLFKNGIPMIRDWLKANGANIIKAGFEAIGRGIRTAVLGMLAVAGLIGQAFVSGVQGIADWVKSGGASRLKDAFIGMLKGIVNYLRTDAWGDLKGAAEFLFDAVIAAAEGLYDGLIGKSLIPDMFNDIASFIRNFDIVSAVAAWAKSAWGRFERFTVDVLNVIKNGIGAVADWIANDAASDLATAATNAAKGAAEALKTAFNNALPDKISIPQISVGGGKIGGVKVPKATIGGQSLNIPQLAEGGIVRKPTLAMIGEAGPEAVVPLSGSESASGAAGTEVHIDQTIESGAFQGVGLEEVKDLAETTFDEWMDSIERSIDRGVVDRADL